MGCASSTESSVKATAMKKEYATGPEHPTILVRGRECAKKASGSLWNVASSHADFHVSDKADAPHSKKSCSNSQVIKSQRCCNSGVDSIEQPRSCKLGPCNIRTQLKNSAFVFIKPHAMNDDVKSLVRASLEAAGIKIVSEGGISAGEIGERMLIDQHYYSIASKATMLKPEQLSVPKISFQDKFGVEWDEALASSRVLNAMDACHQLELDPTELATLWNESKANGNVTKFGGGFYCGKLSPEGKGGPFYILNGFFMAMRSKFVAQGASIHYFVTEWDALQLDWADFRAKVLGPTDPSGAPVSSLRGTLFSKWKDLGLEMEPTTSDNGVHGSASPFEGLTERMNWLGLQPENDVFGQQLLNAGISTQQIVNWSKDPKVSLGPGSTLRPLFDVLENIDANECLNICQTICQASHRNSMVKANSLVKNTSRGPVIMPSPLVSPRGVEERSDHVPKVSLSTHGQGGDFFEVCCKPSVEKSEVYCET